MALYLYRYQEFGAWVKDCFGRSVATTQGSGYQLELTGRSLQPMLLDHVLISEDQSHGQLVLNFTVSAIYYQIQQRHCSSRERLLVISL